MNYRILSVLLFFAVTCGVMQAADFKRIDRVDTDEKIIALTFDDGPDDGTLKMLELFNQEGVKATFFVKGDNVQKRPEVAKAVIAAGSEIGNHTYTHPHLSKLSDEQVRAEIEKTQAVVKEVCGNAPATFRFPYGDSTPAIYLLLEQMNLPVIWTVVHVADWDSKTTTEQIVERSTKDVKPGSVILLHSWPKTTLAALPAIIKFYKDQGYRFVTVSELLAAGKK